MTRKYNFDGQIATAAVAASQCDEPTGDEAISGLDFNDDEIASFSASSSDRSFGLSQRQVKVKFFHIQQGFSRVVFEGHYVLMANGCSETGLLI